MGLVSASTVLCSNDMSQTCSFCLLEAGHASIYGSGHATDAARVRGLLRFFLLQSCHSLQRALSLQDNFRSSRVKPYEFNIIVCSSVTTSLHYSPDMVY